MKEKCKASIEADRNLNLIAPSISIEYRNAYEKNIGDNRKQNCTCKDKGEK